MYSISISFYKVEMSKKECRKEHNCFHPVNHSLTEATANDIGSWWHSMSRREVMSIHVKTSVQEHGSYLPQCGILSAHYFLVYASTIDLFRVIKFLS